MHRRLDIYLDESGDLGYSPRSSKHFVVVAVMFTEPERVSRTLKRICRRRFSRRERSLEFKFNRSSLSTRHLVLNGLASAGPSISWTAIRKEHALVSLRGDKNRLYAMMCSDAVSGLARGVRSRCIRIVLDRRSGSRSIRKGMDSWLVHAVEGAHVGHFPPAVEIRHEDSMTSAGIQAADFIAGAVFQSLEHSDGSYMEGLLDNVVYSGVGR